MPETVAGVGSFFAGAGGSAAAIDGAAAIGAGTLDAGAAIGADAGFDLAGAGGFAGVGDAAAGFGGTDLLSAAGIEGGAGFGLDGLSGLFGDSFGGSLTALDAGAAPSAVGIGDFADAGADTSKGLFAKGGALSQLFGKGGAGMGAAQVLASLYGLSQSKQLSRQASAPGMTQAGLQAVQRSMAAQGYQGSGNMMTALEKYGSQTNMPNLPGAEAGLTGQLSSLGLLTSGLPKLFGWGG